MNMDSGINIPDLLLASHIIPWSKNEKERLNPENGICLSALYDKAFDKGLISLSFQHEVIISEELKQKLKNILLKEKGVSLFFLADRADRPMTGTDESVAGQGHKFFSVVFEGEKTNSVIVLWCFMAYICHPVNINTMV